MTTTTRTPYPGVTYNLDDSGAGEPVLLLHGGGGPRTMEPLRDRNHRIAGLVLMDGIGPDRPGLHFELPKASPAGDGTPHPMQNMFDALAAYTGLSMRDPALLARIARVRIPVQVIWGEEDSVVIPEFGCSYAAAFKHSEYAGIEGASHVPTREKPNEVFAVIDTFISNL